MGAPAGARLVDMGGGRQGVRLTIYEAGILEIMGPYPGWEQSIRRSAEKLAVHGLVLDDASFQWNPGPARMSAVVPVDQYDALMASIGERWAIQVKPEVAERELG